MEMARDPHLGLEMVNFYVRCFEPHQEGKLQGLIDNMAKSNVEIKIISDVMNKLSHAKQKKEPADFSNDETMMRHIVHIHRNNPTIFEDLIKNFPDHLPPMDNALFVGEEITVENVIGENLKEINVWNIRIEPLTETQIDVVVQGLDGELKRHSADLNESMMKINDSYDLRRQTSESARQGSKEDSEHKKSIVSRMRH